MVSRSSGRASGATSVRFYTAIGHDGVVFQDPDVKKHLTGGIMWAVRREHLIK